MQTKNNSAVMDASDSSSKSEMRMAPVDRDLTPKEEQAMGALDDLAHAVGKAIFLLESQYKTISCLFDENSSTLKDRLTMGNAFITNETQVELNDALDDVWSSCGSLIHGARQ